MAITAATRLLTPCGDLKTLFVRPSAEYCTVTWPPYYKKNKELLEKGQHGFIRMINSVRHMDYNENIKALGLCTLEERRNRADLVFLFKMYKGFSHQPAESLFHLPSYDRARGHAGKLVKHCTNRDVRLFFFFFFFFFSERVINKWNKLY